MTMTKSLAAALALALAAPAAGCFGRGPQEPTRYFRPGSPPAAPRAAAEAAAGPAAPALRLRRVVAAAYLQERMARRTSEVELGFSDLARWAEQPATYVERALARELFEARGLPRTEATSGAHLDVEVRAFEEVTAPAHTAAVALAVILADGRDAVLLERSFAAERPIEGSDPEAVARAMGAALEDAARAAARAVEAALRGAKGA
jgi:ABC-type uncharacterized transport system auxiliary subunit